VPASREIDNQQLSLEELGTPLIHTTFCVVDLETTGGDRNTDMITEIGAVKVRGGEVLGTFQTLVNPGCAIPPRISILTGLTDALVATAPRIEAVLPSFLEFLGDAILVAHNAAFDVGFLRTAIERSGRGPFTPRVLDTVPLARRLVRSEVPDCKLGTLAFHLRLAHQPSHRALDDVLATVDLLHFLIERASGHGVMGLDDLMTLSGAARHPQAAKLGLTHDLPRTPGVYMFYGPNEDLLYVGKATNLRQRVRSYFSTDDRRKIGPLLRETQRISHIELPDPLSAEVAEQRLIARHLPRYNRVGTRADRYCYIRLDVHQAWPRLSVTRSLSPKALHLGPLPSRRMAQMAIDAIVTVIPLRRCSVRIPKHHVAEAAEAAANGACTAARLGLTECPCTGTADPERYREAVAAVQRIWDLSAEPAVALGPVESLLFDRVRTLASQQRFEEAAELRDNMTALRSVLRRHHLIARLRCLDTVEISRGPVTWRIEQARLTDVRTADRLVWTLGSPAPDAQDDLSQPLARDAIDEALVLAKFLDRHSSQLEVSPNRDLWNFPLELSEELARLGPLDFSLTA
jgi:DNA polymerase III subunit epsilon